MGEFPLDDRGSGDGRQMANTENVSAFCVAAKRRQKQGALRSVRR